MNFIQTIERLQLLHRLIAQKRTGSPEKLATLLGVSRSHLYTMIEELKSLDIQILYSRKKRTFYYENEVEIEIEFRIQTLSKDELEKLNAGTHTFTYTSTGIVHSSSNSQFELNLSNNE